MQRSDLNLLLEAYNNIINTPITPVGFKNRVHQDMIKLGKYKGEGPSGEGQHLTEKGYWYRTLGSNEIEDIRNRGGVFPREGKQNGGNINCKYWLKGNGINWYNKNQTVIRANEKYCDEDKIVNSNNVELLNQSTGKFEPITNSPVAATA